MGLIFWIPTVAYRRIPEWHSPPFGTQPYAIISLLAVASVLYAVIVFSSIRLRRLRPALLTLGGGMLAICAIVFGLYFPNAQFLRTSFAPPRSSGAIGATQPGEVDMVDYKEPSLGFYQGGTIREQKSSFLLPKHWNEWGRWMVVTKAAWDKAPPESRARLRKVPDPENPVRGWAYADAGSLVELIVVERISLPPADNMPPPEKVDQ